MYIRTLEPSDAEIYRSIRLQALQQHPDAFLATYQMEKQKPFETTKQNLQPSSSRFTLGCFTYSNELIDIVTFIQESNPKISHKGNVFAMYVSPQHRGNGLAMYS